MTAPIFLRLASPGRTRRPDGVALVIVLAFLVLISGLVISFFLTATTDVGASRNYAQETTTKEMSDAAVNLVMAQIKDATAGVDKNTAATLAWASQPGMIRTWDDSGYFNKAFKLYSSDNMVAAGTAFDPSADYNALTTPALWNAGAAGKSYTALYADLNSPVADVSYVAVSSAGVSNGAGVGMHYPIMDPSGDQNTSKVIEGFHISTPPGYVGNSPPTATQSTIVGPANNPAPMPVKWLYVLQDGTLAPASLVSGSTTKVTIGNSTVTPSKANPIVGRIAFWTDDDTCKVNLNTASEGSYWDVPRVQNMEDHGVESGTTVCGYSTSVPTNTEYQRIPGHPATTSLSTVFGYRFGKKPVYIATADSSTYSRYFQPYYDMVPRLAAGGTQGGTVSITTVGAKANPLLDGDRLLASVDELLFKPLSASLPPNRDLNGSSSLVTTNFTKSDIEKTRFFLTTNSRAPEVNLYNKPRISLWPLMADNTPATDISNNPNPSPRRNANDDLLAFCASVGIDKSNTLDPRTGKNPYYFQRYKAFLENNNSNQPAGATNYINPGSSQSTTDDLNVTKVPRNQQLLQYLHDLTNKNVPGYGGSLATKFGTDNDQVLTEAFDYIRAGINSSNTNVGAVNSTGYTSDYNYAPYDYNSYKSTGSNFFVVGAGGVVPIQRTMTSGAQTTTTMGFGRFITIREVTILLFATNFKDITTVGTYNPTTKIWSTPTTGADGLPDDEPDASGNYDGIGDPRTTQIQAVLFITPTLVSPGNPIVSPAVRYQIDGLDQFSVTYGGSTTNLGFPSVNQAVETVQGDAGMGFDASTQFYSQCTYTPGSKYSSTPRSLGPPASVPPGQSSNFVTDPDLKKLVFSGANVTIAADPTTAPNPSNYALSRNDPSTDGSKDRLIRSLTASTMLFSGGSIKIKIYPGLYSNIAAASPNNVPIQEYDLTFPPATVPVPMIVRATVGSGGNKDFDGALQGGGIDPSPPNPSTDATDLGSPADPGKWLGATVGSTVPTLCIPFYTGSTVPYQTTGGGTGYWNGNPMAWSTRMSSLPVGTSSPSLYWLKPAGGSSLTPTGVAESTGSGFPEAHYPAGILRRGDVVRSIAIDPAGPARGDVRLVAALPVVPSNYFAPIGGNPTPTNLTPPYYDPTRFQVHGWLFRSEFGTDLRQAMGYNETTGTAPNTTEIPDPRNWPARGASDERGVLIAGQTPSVTNASEAILGLNGAFIADGRTPATPGDWDNGIGNYYDGPYINQSDQGYATNGDVNYNDYYPLNFKDASSNGTETNGAAATYSPNRQIASPVMFGSLSTGVLRQKPWQTLLFCPNPAAGDIHPGFGTSGGVTNRTALAPYTLPPDHVFLDLFNMPIVEPYAISEAFSTAGKVNMNYQIQPFTNVERSTAVRAVIKGTKIQAIHGDFGNGLGRTVSGQTYVYKTFHEGEEHVTSGLNTGWSSRYDLSPEATLVGFTNRFNGVGGTPDIFHSASEICGIFLVPQNANNPAGYPWTTPQVAEGAAPVTTALVWNDTTGAAAAYNATAAWWKPYTLTGDNARESPYNSIYPRLTTKSNTYTVHMRVQSLKKLTASDPVTWDETKDVVLSEYRGSSSIERYIDPDDPTLPDFGGYRDANGLSLVSTDPKLNMDSYYRFRVVSSKQFQP